MDIAQAQAQALQLAQALFLVLVRLLVHLKALQRNRTGKSEAGQTQKAIAIMNIKPTEEKRTEETDQIKNKL